MKKTFAYQGIVTLSYADYGNPNGFPVLVQHGLIASIDDGDLFQRLVAAGLRVICVARPGYGQSTPYLMASYAEWAQIVSVLVAELNLSRFDVLGISSGAPYAYALGAGMVPRVRNLYILSGMPALYDGVVRASWPYGPLDSESMADFQNLARELFFSNLSAQDRLNPDVRDSMAHGGFGVAQDLKLRWMDWGFALRQVRRKVYMRHSKTDDSVPFAAAARTAELLPDCKLDALETGPHFSKAALDDFIRNTIIPNLPPVDAGAR